MAERQVEWPRFWLAFCISAPAYQSRNGDKYKCYCPLRWSFVWISKMFQWHLLQLCGVGKLSRYYDLVRNGWSEERITVGAKIFLTLPDRPWVPKAFCRLQFKCDGTMWRTVGEVKGELASGVRSQYFSHYLGTCCIQHYYRWCAQLGCQ